MLPSGRQSTVKRIVTADGDLTSGIPEQAVTITLADEIDVSRGDVLCAANTPVEVSDQFEVQVLWMGDQEMLPGRPYIIKAGTKTITGTLDKLKYKVNVNTMEHVAASSLALNEIAVCALELDASIAFAPYEENRALGSFIIIDRFSNATVGMGLIRFALRRAANIHWQATDVNKESRGKLLKQKPAVLWFTGLSGRASRPSPTWWRKSSMPKATSPTCSMATTCVTVSTETWALLMQTVSRTFAASAKWRASWRMPA